MREILESEVAEALPALLAEVAKEGAAIPRNGKPIADAISPREFDTTRLARAQRALAALDDLCDEISKDAAERGIDLHELVSALDRKAP